MVNESAPNFKHMFMRKYGFSYRGDFTKGGRPVWPLFDQFTDLDYEWVATEIERIDPETATLIVGMFESEHAHRVLQKMAGRERE